MEFITHLANLLETNLIAELEYFRVRSEKGFFMLVVGLTGGIGCGKSTIGKEFKKLGAYIIDADKIAQEILKPKTVVGRKVINCFGKQILHRVKGKLYINREKLAKIVFANKKKLEKLNSLMHPSIINLIQKEIEKLKGKKKIHVVVIDAPLLFEVGMGFLMDKIIVVKVPLALQIERVKKRNGLSRKEILQRAKFQWSLQKKVKYADYLIDNYKDIKIARKDVKNIWEELTSIKR